MIAEAKEKERIERENKGKVEEEDEFEVDWDDFVLVQTIDFEEDEDVFLKPDLETLGIDDVSRKIERVERNIKHELYEMQGVKEGSEIEPGMKIVKNYQKRKREEKESTQTCPKCGKQIPMSEWTEHMKIELLDPKWRDEKVDSLHREKNPMTAQGDEISRSLKKFVQSRPDIAGVDASNRVEDMTQDQTNRDQNKVYWDGHSSSITRTTANSAMLAKQQSRNIADTMRNRPDMFPQAPNNMPMPGYRPPPNAMQFRPPTQSQLMGYPAPPNPNQGPPMGLVPPKKVNPNNQQNQQNQNR